MEKVNRDIERQLVILCNDFINIFNQLLVKGLISEEEYEVHVKPKKIFLDNKKNILKIQKNNIKYLTFLFLISIIVHS